MGRNNLDSPERVHRSSHIRSPSKRDGSPSSHYRTSHREKLSRDETSASLKRSPKRARSRSPESHSLAREKIKSHARSPKYKRSISPGTRSPIREKPTSRTRSPKPRKSISPVSQLPEISRPSSHARSTKGTKSESPDPGSSSPRTKRLRRVQDERESEKMRERAAEKHHGRRDGRVTNKEKTSDREFPHEGKEMSRREEIDNGSSRLRSRSSISPSDHHRHNGRRKSTSPADNRARDEVRNSRRDEGRKEDDDSMAKMKAAEEALQTNDKHKPSFELSGKLAAETNRVRGVTLLFTEPPEARKPSVRWRLYVFKGGEVLNEPLYIHRQSCYLFGRERRVADVPTDHPSCSKQHAVLQYRQVEKENPDGTLSKRVSPYLMDLGSTNGTHINDDRMEPQRYYELFERDTIKFGNSSREYVLLHENSA